MNATVLSARATLVGATPYKSVVFDQSKLTNLTRTPIEIREIIVTVSGQTLKGSVSAIVNVKGKVGRCDLTDGEVPMSVLAPARLWEIDDVRNLQLNANTMTMLGFQGAVRWQFRRPLVLRPGAGFAFVARYDAADVAILNAAPVGVTLADTVVTITAVGRFLPPGAPVPQVQAVPYVSAARINTANVAGAGGDKTLLSAQDALGNPNAVPFMVQRIVGHRFFMTTSATFPVVAVPAQDSLYAGTSDFTKVLFNLSFPDNTDLAGGRIPFDGVFAQRRAVEGDFIVPPTGRCIAEIFASQRNYAAAGVANEVIKIGIVGDRQEAV